MRDLSTSASVVETCKYCGHGIDMSLVGATRCESAYGVFCSMRCADLWESDDGPEMHDGPPALPEAIEVPD